MAHDSGRYLDSIRGLPPEQMQARAPAHVRRARRLARMAAAARRRGDASQEARYLGRAAKIGRGVA